MTLVTATARHRVHYDNPEGQPAVALPGTTFTLEAEVAAALLARSAIVNVAPVAEPEPAPKAKRQRRAAAAEPAPEESTPDPDPVEAPVEEPIDAEAELEDDLLG